MRLLFYIAKHGGFTDKVVSFVTQSKYSHVDLQFSDGKHFSAGMTEKGVYLKEKEINLEEWDIIELPKDKEDVVRAWCETQVGKRYNLLTLINYLLPVYLPLHRSHSTYCSEIITRALAKGEIIHFHRKVSPGRLYELVYPIRDLKCTQL